MDGVIKKIRSLPGEVNLLSKIPQLMKPKIGQKTIIYLIVDGVRIVNLGLMIVVKVVMETQIDNHHTKEIILGEEEDKEEEEEVVVIFKENQEVH